MTDIELAEMLLDIAAAVEETFPKQAQILVTVAGLTAFFDPVALEPLADMARLFSEVGLEIVGENLKEN